MNGIADRPFVWIAFDPSTGMWDCGDEDGYFASASNRDMLAPYVDQLVVEHGTAHPLSMTQRTIQGMPR